MNAPRRRFWVEVGFAATAAVLGVVTLIWKDWIELIFGADPDGGSGETEWQLVAVLFAVAVVLALLAGWEWRRRPTPATG